MFKKTPQIDPSRVQYVSHLHTYVVPTRPIVKTIFYGVLAYSSAKFVSTVCSVATNEAFAQAAQEAAEKAQSTES